MAKKAPKKGTKAVKAATAQTKKKAPVKAKPASKPVARKPTKPVAKATSKPQKKAVAKTKSAARPQAAGKAKPVAKKAGIATQATKKTAAPAKPIAKKADDRRATAKSTEKTRMSTTPVHIKGKVTGQASQPAPRKPSGPVAVAVVAPKSRTPAEMVRRPHQPIKVSGNEIVRPKLPTGYHPSPKEPYMNPKQLEYFRLKLMKWRAELVEESKQTIDNLRDEVRDVGDEAERATRETENSLELRTRDRYRKLISKIDKALRRIEDGEYGYCEETGEEIGLERLEARPIATLCLDAQERWEHRQRQMGD